MEPSHVRLHNVYRSRGTYVPFVYTITLFKNFMAHFTFKDLFFENFISCNFNRYVFIWKAFLFDSVLLYSILLYIALFCCPLLISLLFQYFHPLKGREASFAAMAAAPIFAAQVWQRFGPQWGSGSAFDSLLSCLSVYLSVCLSICLYVCLSICLSLNLCVRLSLCMYISLCIYVSVYLSVCVYVCVCLSFSLYVKLSVCVSIFLLIHFSVRLPVRTCLLLSYCHLLVIFRNFRFQLDWWAASW